MSPDEFVQLLEGVKPRGRDKWIACCPAHDDRDPSLSITATPQGKILLRCFAGCSALEVTQSLGLGLQDLFPEEHSEDPMGFAKKEMAKRRHRAAEVEHAKTYLAILTAKLKDKKPVTEQEIKKGRQLKAFLSGVLA